MTDTKKRQDALRIAVRLAELTEELVTLRERTRDAELRAALDADWPFRGDGTQAAGDMNALTAAIRSKLLGVPEGA